MRKHWDRWGWVVGLAIVAIGFLRVFWGREAFCEPNEHCLREWVSALSGWAAVAAAVPTVFFLSRQVTDAREFNEKAVMMQTAPVLHNAMHVATLCGVLAIRVDEDLEGFKKLSGDDLTADLDIIVNDIKYTLNLVRREEFNDAARVFGSYVENKEAINNLTEALNFIEENEITTKEDFIELTHNFLPSAYFSAKFFSENLEKAARQRISYAENLLEV